MAVGDREVKNNVYKEKNAGEEEKKKRETEIHKTQYFIEWA